jgi:hypothetical protein
VEGWKGGSGEAAIQYSLEGAALGTLENGHALKVCVSMIEAVPICICLGTRTEARPGQTHAKLIRAFAAGASNPEPAIRNPGTFKPVA